MSDPFPLENTHVNKSIQVSKSMCKKQITNGNGNGNNNDSRRGKHTKHQPTEKRFTTDRIKSNPYSIIVAVDTVVGRRGDKVCRALAVCSLCAKDDKNCVVAAATIWVILCKRKWMTYCTTRSQESTEQLRTAF